MKSLLLLFTLACLTLFGCQPTPPDLTREIAALDRTRVLTAADAFLPEPTRTITDTTCERSAGDSHDFYSEGDYWWPDSTNPGGPYIRRDGLSATKTWFADFTSWITTHPYGLEEKNNGNNHSTCWAMQVAMYARFTQNDALISECKSFYQQTLLPEQMAQDGSFPKELARTKPYGYSLFNLDAMYTLVHILAEDEPELWAYTYQDTLHMKKVMDFMLPYIEDKQQWPYPPDVMYFEDWPMRQAALLFAYQAYEDEKYLQLWKTLPADSDTDEVIRNFFVRQPLLWVEPARQ